MNDLNVKELSHELQDAIAGLKQAEGLDETGVVTRVSDGVVWVYGLRQAGFSDVILVEMEGGAEARAFALNLLRTLSDSGRYAQVATDSREGGHGRPSRSRARESNPRPQRRQATRARAIAPSPALPGSLPACELRPGG